MEADQPTTRINDGRCDRQGRFVFGTFNRERGGEAIGHFSRVGWQRGLQLEPLPLPPIRVANSTDLCRTDNDADAIVRLEDVPAAAARLVKGSGAHAA